MMGMVSFSPELDVDSRIDDYTAYLELWSAVLRCAISDIENDRKRRKKGTQGVTSYDAHTALTWIMDDSPHRFGFLWTCSLLSLDPNSVRNRVLTADERAAYAQSGALQ